MKSVWGIDTSGTPETVIGIGMASGQRQVVALAGSSGAMVWSSPLPSSVLVFVLPQALWNTTNWSAIGWGPSMINDTVTTFDREGGAVWSQVLPFSSRFSPQVIFAQDQYLIFADINGGLAALDTRGNRLWTRYVYSSPSHVRDGTGRGGTDAGWVHRRV
jgi:hypothetical protein